MNCLSCNHRGGGWKREGLQQLPTKGSGGKRITVWEAWTCPACGSTHLFNPEEEK